MIDYFNINKLLKNKFLRNSMLYTFGSMVTPLIGFLMLPVYTNYLTPTDYGIMTTVQTLVGMAQLFLIVSLNSAVTRFFYDFLDNPQKQKDYLGSIFVFCLIFSSLVSVLLLLFSNLIGPLLFKNIPVDPFYYYLIGLSWVTALSTLPMTLYRVQEKAGMFVLLNVIKALLVMGITIYLIIGKGLGAESILISQISVTFLIDVIMFVMQLKFLSLSFNLQYIKQSLLFSIPLLPHVASTWIISSSDRIILEKFVEMADIGIYALAVQVSMVLTLFYNSVNRALVPRYTKLRKEGNELKADRLLKLFFYVVFTFGLVSIPIAMYGLKLIISEQYYGAIPLLPFLLLGQIVTGFYFIPAAKLFYAKKTKEIAISSVLSAVINIIINLIFIPVVGIYGAVISTITAECFRFLFITISSKKVASSNRME